ncbi:MAG: YdeI/OmpD-associated family protein [Bacteroidota bacterium]|nr:YdeI/OmpD-associated family protein [Bacteroidota bacterium]
MDPRVDEYIRKKGDSWSRPILQKLRSILLSMDLEEGVKWGSPTYMNQGNVVSMAVFKEYVSLWFYQGALLEDPENVLIAAADSTQALRQWRFQHEDDVPDEKVRSYVAEALNNQIQGKKVKMASKRLLIPKELKEAFEKEPSIREFFDGLPPSSQRDFADHINSAKKEETRIRRLEKSLDLMRQGKDLNWKYR